MSRTASILWITAALTGLCSAALAAGTVGQVAAVGHAGMVGSVSAVGTGVGGGYSPVSVDSLVNTSSINTPGGAASAAYSAGINASTSSGLNVQTNIDSSKSVTGASNIAVNETINGVNYAYGLNGASTLDVIDVSAAETGSTIAQHQADNQNTINQALWIAQVMQSTQSSQPAQTYRGSQNSQSDQSYQGVPNYQYSTDDDDQEY